MLNRRQEWAGTGRVNRTPHSRSSSGRDIVWWPKTVAVAGVTLWTGANLLGAWSSSQVRSRCCRKLQDQG